LIDPHDRACDRIESALRSLILKITAMKTSVSWILPLLFVVGVIGCNRRPHAGEDAMARADARRLEELRTAERNASDREAAARDAEADLARRKAEQQSEELTRENAALAARAKDAEEAAEKNRAAVAASERKSADAKTEQTLDFFYDALEPHGDWIEIADYGFAWKPRMSSDPRWRPYLDGHWAWTDYGWTWVANEPFGWATYHYGRWTRVQRLGWVWLPGSEWAPAWVAWRSNDRVVGWAPLPPEAHSGSGFSAAVDNYYDIGPGAYAFVPVEEFGDATYLGKIEEPSENISIVNQTVNVTNISYRNVQNKTVVHNDGPSLNLINRKSKTPVRTLKVEREEAVSRGAGAATTDRDVNVLRLPAPTIRSAAKPNGAPRKVQERARRDELDRGWTGADPEKIKQAKEHQAREARHAEEQQSTTAAAAPATVHAAPANPATPPPAPAATSTPPIPPANAAPGAAASEHKKREIAGEMPPGEKLPRTPGDPDKKRGRSATPPPATPSAAPAATPSPSAPTLREELSRRRKARAADEKPGSDR